MARKKAAEQLGAVDVALRVVRTLATSQGMSAVEIASNVASSPEFISSILQKLEDHGFVFKDLLDLFWLGPQLHYLGGHISERNVLLHASTETLEKIVPDPAESAAILMRENLEAVLVTSRGSSGILGLRPLGVSRGPLHSGGASKVLLAHAPQEVIDAVLDKHLDSFTPASLRNREAALTLLGEIRRDGYYVSVGESHPEVVSISSPIRNAHGRVVAVMAVFCYRERFDGQSRAHLIKAVLSGAEQVSSRLG